MSRLVTLSQLRTDIAAQCDFSTSTTGRYTPTLLNRLINQSIQRFRERISNEGITHFLVSSSGTLPAGRTSPYSFQTLDLSTLNPSLVRTYGLDITIAGVVRSLEQRSFTERNEFIDGPDMTGQPIAWAHFQSASVAVMPAPDTAYPYTVWYLPVLADLSSDSDTFDGVAGWENYVVWDCVCQLIARDQYAAAYSQAVLERDKSCEDIIRSATKVSAAGGAFVGRDTMGKVGLWGRGRMREIGGTAGSSQLPPQSSITNSMLANRSGPVVIGRLLATSGAPSDVPVSDLTPYLDVFAGSAPGLVPSGTGSPADTLRGDGTWGNSTTAASGLSAAALAPIQAPRVLGRFSAGSGAVEQIVGGQVASMIPWFSTTAAGLVPYPSGITGKFLKDDGTWAAAAGGGGGGAANLPGGPTGSVQYNAGSGVFGGASGFLWDGMALQRFGDFDIPTGAIRGPAGTGYPADGLYRFGSANVSVLAGKSTAGLDAQLLQWMVDGPDIETIGRNTAVVKRFNRANQEHRWFINGADKSHLDAGQFALKVGVQLGAAQLGFATGFGDKLGGWTASGFANVATGIAIVASGQALAFGPNPGGSGTIQFSNGMQFYGTNGTGAPFRIFGISAGNGDLSFGDNQPGGSNQFYDVGNAGAHILRTAFVNRVVISASGLGMQANTKLTHNGQALSASGFYAASKDLEGVRRINGVDGQKGFGDLSSSSASGVVAVNAGSGTIFHITASVAQSLALQPSAVHGDAILIQNRSAATHTVYNLGTGMGAPSGEIFKINPSGAAWARYASGAWELASRFQLGGF